MKKTILLITIAALAVICLGGCNTETVSTPGLTPPSNVVTATDYITETPIMGTIEKYVGAPGSYRSPDAHTLFFTVSGTISKINVQYNHLFQEGDVLVELAESADYLLEYQKTEREIHLHETSMQALKEESEGTGGDAALAYFKWLQAENEYEALKASESPSADALEASRIAAARAKVDYDNCLRTAKEKYSDALAEYEIMQIELKQAYAKYEACFLKAPISGQITWARRGSVGSWVNAYQQLLTIESPNNLGIIYQGSTSDSTYLKSGQTVSVTVDGGAVYTASVLYTPDTFPSEINYNASVIYHNDKTSTAASPFFLKVEGLPADVKLNTSIANIRILAKRSENCMMVHPYLVFSELNEEDKTVYYVNVSVNGIPVKRYVTKGVENNEFVEITSGLRLTDKVIYTP